MKKNRLFEERKRKVSAKAKELVDSAFKRIDEEHELLKNKNLPKEDLFQSISKTTNMKKEFTIEQLVTIRDVFADMCDKQIERGKRDLAEEYLDIVNVVQAKTGCDEFESLEDFQLDGSGTYGYAEKRELDDLEEVAVDEMIAFAKSFDEQPWEILKARVNNYLEDVSANTGMTRKDTIDRRTICINRLIIHCIHACTSEELKRLDGIVKELAENI